jgi:hypothetical protein
MRKTLLGLAILSLALVFYGQPAQAITILNPSFEQPVLNDGVYTGTFDSWSASGSVSTWNPTVASFPGEAPDGSNVAAVGPGAGSIYQVLTATVQANTTYTLEVDVGNRQDFGFDNFVVALLAGGDTLASNSGPSPADGTFITNTLTFITGASPLQLGQNLVILLGATGSNPGQVDFDNVRLSATAVPIPGAAWLLGSGLLGLCALGRRRKRS